MSQDKIQSAIARKAQAETLLRSELLTEAWAAVDKELIDLWRRTVTAAERDRIWQATQIAERVQALLRSYIMDGKLAQAELDALIAADKAA